MNMTTLCLRPCAQVGPRACEAQTPDKAQCCTSMTLSNIGSRVYDTEMHSHTGRYHVGAGLHFSDCSGSRVYRLRIGYRAGRTSTMAVIMRAPGCTSRVAYA